MRGDHKLFRNPLDVNEWPFAKFFFGARQAGFEGASRGVTTLILWVPSDNAAQADKAPVLDFTFFEPARSKVTVQ